MWQWTRGASRRGWSFGSKEKQLRSRRGQRKARASRKAKAVPIRTRAIPRHAGGYLSRGLQRCEVRCSSGCCCRAGPQPAWFALLFSFIKAIAAFAVIRQHNLLPLPMPVVSVLSVRTACPAASAFSDDAISSLGLAAAFKASRPSGASVSPGDDAIKLADTAKNGKHGDRARARSS